jgi:hypothetical protein
VALFAASYLSSVVLGIMISIVCCTAVEVRSWPVASFAASQDHRRMMSEIEEKRTSRGHRVSD